MRNDPVAPSPVSPLPPDDAARATMAALALESRRILRAAQLLAAADEALAGVADGLRAVRGDPALCPAVVNELIDTARFDGARLLVGGARVRIGAQAYRVPILRSLDPRDPALRTRTIPARLVQVADARRELRAFVQGPLARYVSSMSVTLRNVVDHQRCRQGEARPTGHARRAHRRPAPLRLVRE